jgi:hypothetical protein
MPAKMSPKCPQKCHQNDQKMNSKCHKTSQQKCLQNAHKMPIKKILAQIPAKRHTGAIIPDSLDSRAQ